MHDSIFWWRVQSSGVSMYAVTGIIHTECYQTCVKAIYVCSYSSLCRCGIVHVHDLKNGDYTRDIKVCMHTRIQEDVCVCECVCVYVCRYSSCMVHNNIHEVNNQRHSMTFSRMSCYMYHNTLMLENFTLLL